MNSHIEVSCQTKKHISISGRQIMGLEHVGYFAMDMIHKHFSNIPQSSNVEIDICNMLIKKLVGIECWTTTGGAMERFVTF